MWFFGLGSGNYSFLGKINFYPPLGVSWVSGSLRIKPERLSRTGRWRNVRKNTKRTSPTKFSGVTSWKSLYISVYIISASTLSMMVLCIKTWTRSVVGISLCFDTNVPLSRSPRMSLLKETLPLRRDISTTGGFTEMNESCRARNRSESVIYAFGGSKTCATHILALRNRNFKSLFIIVQKHEHIFLVLSKSF